MKYFILLYVFILVFFISNKSILYADEVPNTLNLSETELFDSKHTTKELNNIDRFLEKNNKQVKTIDFSGDFHYKIGYLFSNDWINGKNIYSKNLLKTEADSNFYIDIRLNKGFKTYLNLNLSKNFSTTANNTIDYYSFDSLFKECFIDFNYNYNSYFRVGKQVLHWNRTLIWNPIDLVNIENKDVFNSYINKNGTYGFKSFFQVADNQDLTLFFNLTDANNTDKIGIASRYTIALNSSEIGVSLWNKAHYKPIYGLDFSTGFMNINFLGECVLRNGSDVKVLKTNSELTYLDILANQWYPQLCLSVNKYFDFEINDRILTFFEVFYNSIGYSNNILLNNNQRNFLLANDLYTPLYLNKLYIGYSTTISKFPFYNTSLNFTGINNIIDKSSLYLVNMKYNPIYDLSMDFKVYYYTFVDSKSEFGYLVSGSLIDNEMITNSLAFELLFSVCF